MRLSREQLAGVERAAEEHLTERERKVLWLYYGLEPDLAALSATEIGSLLGVEQDVVHEIRQRALDKLRGVPDVEASGLFIEAYRRPRRRVRSHTSALEIVIEPGSALAEEIADLYSALSDLYRAYGGTGLAFRATTDITIVSGAL